MKNDWKIINEFERLFKTKTPYFYVFYTKDRKTLCYSKWAIEMVHSYNNVGDNKYEWYLLHDWLTANSLFFKRCPDYLDMKEYGHQALEICSDVLKFKAVKI